MADITDFDTVLTPLKNTATSRINTIKNEIDKRIRDCETFVNNQVNQLKQNIISYIDSKSPTNYFVDSTAFRTFLTKLGDTAQSRFDNSTDALIDYISREHDYIYIDYSPTIDDIYGDVVDGINKARMDNVVKDEKVDDKISAALKDLNNSISDLYKFIDDRISAIVKSLRTSQMSFRDTIAERLAYVYKNRPLVRIAGVIEYPQEIAYDSDNNVFRIPLQNIGTKPWTGRVLVNIEDQYHKQVNEEYNAIKTKVPATTIAPNAKDTIERRVYIPKVVKTSEGDRNLGDQLTFKFIIYTE